jgi:hypothetical protein
VVVVEPPNAFFSVHAGVRDALLHTGLSFETVGSSVGAIYLRFASGGEREEAMRMQPFFHDDARIDLFREEEYDRVRRMTKHVRSLYCCQRSRSHDQINSPKYTLP